LTIQNWAKLLELDAVIWTNLPPKFNDTDGQVPTIDDAVSYLRNADINTRTKAEEYISKAPKQIDTDYRRRFETEFGWTYIE
jgi:hypothetical protein